MTPERKGTTVETDHYWEKQAILWQDLQVPIFAPTWSTVRETHRMSLAQDAAETREVDLRDQALLRSVQWALGFFWPQGTRK